jgi:eukaryotic-like serine/threonine-protein kinase
VHYAHERGIVHRDLTPANILMTRDGIPKITDFGLAKLLVGGDAGQTQTGAILGTPSYMSPEQASGQAKHVGAAADIYSLGAMLYDMLTGRPPFKAETPFETVMQVANQEPVAPTVLQPKLPRDLETICLKCLQKEPGKRYSTAADLAADLRRFQAGEPIQARPVSSLERGWRWCRRNRLAASLCVAIGVALVAASVVSVLFAIHSERARRDISYEQAETARERDEKAKALVAETNARAAEKQARDKAMAALRAMTDELIEDQMARGTQLTEENREFLRQIIKHFEEFAGITANDLESRAIRAEGYFRVGRMRSRLGEFTDAASAYSAALALRKQLVADAPARPEFRQQLADSHNNLGLLLHGMGRLKEAELAQNNALVVRKQLADEFPNRSKFRQELAWSFNNLSTVLEAMGRLKEAEPGYLAAIALQQRLREDFPARSEYRHDLARHKYNLGNLLRACGRLKEAEMAFSESLDLRKGLVTEFPRRPELRYLVARTQVNLGNVLATTGRMKEADSVHAEALTLLKQLAAEYPTRPDFRHDLAKSQANLGHRLRDSGRPDEAEKSYAAAVALAKRLADDFPTQPEYRQDLAKGHQDLGVLLATMGRLEEAEQAYHAALALRKQLETDFPELPGLRHELAGNHYNLAILFGDTGRVKEAEAAFNHALGLQRKLLADHPTRTRFRQELGGSLNGLGTLLQATGRLKEAETVLAEALAIRKQLASEFRNQPDIQNELAGTYVNVAVLCRERSDFKGAKAYLEEAAPHHESALKANPLNPTYREFYQNNLGNLIQTNADLGDPVAAKRTAERFRDLGWDPPGDAYDAACYLARCIASARKLEHATTEERDKQMRFYGDEAMKMLRVAVAKGWKDSSHMKNDSDLDPLRDREDFKKMLAELEAGKKPD